MKPDQCKSLFLVCCRSIGCMQTAHSPAYEVRRKTFNRGYSYTASRVAVAGLSSC